MSACPFDPKLWAVCVLLSALSFGGGYVKGMISADKECEQKQDKSENKAFKEAKQIELKASSELSNIGTSYVEEKKSNAVAAAAINIGLRVKSSCPSLPTVAAPGSRIDAAGTEERPRAVEVDFTDVAREVRQLGLDYDNAVTKISELQNTVAVYQRVCGINNP